MKNRNLFTYWENPPGEKIPAYIDLCLTTLIEKANDFEQVVVLNPWTVDYYLGDTLLNPKWKELPVIAWRADCIRVAMIHKFGGIWVDADTVFLRSPSQLLEGLGDETDILYTGWDDGRVLNGYFAAKAGSEVTSRWLALINQQLENLDSLRWTSFGEKIITPLVYWYFPERAKRFDRSFCLPINIDTEPETFFRGDPLENHVNGKSPIVGLNHSWFRDYMMRFVELPYDRVMKEPLLINQLFRRALS